MRRAERCAHNRPSFTKETGAGGKPAPARPSRWLYGFVVGLGSVVSGAGDLADQPAYSDSLNAPSPSLSRVLKSLLSVDCELTSALESFPSLFASRSLKPVFMSSPAFALRATAATTSPKSVRFMERLLGCADE